MKRKEQAQEARKKLIAMAQKLVEEKGYENITITDITKACDMSVGNFYHYFSSKQDIITALERRPYEQMVQNLSTMENKSFVEQVKSYIAQYIDVTVKSYGVNFNRQWFIYHLSPSANSDGNNKMAVDISTFKTILNRGIETGELQTDAPVDDIATFVCLELSGTTVYHIMSNGQFDACGWSRKFADLVIDTALKPYLA